uniref:Calpain catalytic domain-containing protein n=1 Tax=Macrostomum lignano TaxID=282301 RepID=A0A1I8FZZ6_9PLAT
VVGKTATTEDDDDDDDDDDDLDDSWCNGVANKERTDEHSVKTTTTTTIDDGNERRRQKDNKTRQDLDDEDDDEDDRASIQSADSVLSTNIDATERNSAVDNDSDKTTNDTELQSERPTSLSSLLVHQKSLGKSEAYPSSDGSGGSEDDLSSNDGDAKKSGPVEVNGEFGLSGSQKKRSVRPRHSRRNLLRLQRRLKRKQKRRARKRRQAALAAAAAAVVSPREGRRRIGTRDSTLTAAGVDVEEDEDDPYTAGVSSRMRLTHRLDRQWRGQASAARSHTWRRPFGSFAPSRSGVKAQWYLDGGAYMYAVADAIDSAATEIWICANRLSPEVHLRRPDATGQHQLGSALMHKAKSGVRVCLLLDNPTCMAGVNFALHVVDYFEGTPNVHVLLHPTDPSTGCFALAKDCWSVLRAALVARKRLYSACFNGYCGKRSEVDKRPCHCCFPSQVKD